MNYNRLVSKIEQITNEVYFLNESLDMYDRRSLIMGFEDGMNEERSWAEWAGGGVAWLQKKAANVVGQVKQGLNYAIEKGNEYYERGKELAGEAWDSIKKFSADVLNGLTTAYKSALDTIQSGYNKFISMMSNAYTTASEAIKSAYNKLKEKGEAFVNACKSIYQKVIENSILAYQATKEKFISMGNGFTKWINNNADSIKKQAEEAKTSTVAGISKLGEMVSNAMTKTGEFVSNAMTKTGEVASKVAMIALFVIVWPIKTLINGIKSIPLVYDSAVDAVSKFVESTISDFKKGHTDEMGKNESLKYIISFNNFNN